MIITKFKHIVLTLLTLGIFTSCSMMTEEEPDCNPYFKVRFLFDKNILFADAFSSQVGEVDLYLFTPDGRLAWKGHEEGEALRQEDFMMDLPVAPGHYKMLAWGRKRREKAADFILGDEGALNSIQDYKMRLEREYDGSTPYSSSDIHALFHGALPDVELPDNWGTHVVKLPLTKDTNTLRVTLVHLSGKEVKEEDFDFLITDNNGFLDHDNSILDDETVEYRAWSKREGIAHTILPLTSDNTSIGSKTSEDTSNSPSQVHSLVAEITTSRLQTCRRPMLTVIRRADNEKVINIPLLDYLLMVKGEYHRNMTDDDYLDRQDEYTMTFFMNEDGSWYKAVVDILSWRVVLIGEDL